jgi:hypothetical protein
MICQCRFIFISKKNWFVDGRQPPHLGAGNDQKVPPRDPGLQQQKRSNSFPVRPKNSPRPLRSISVKQSFRIFWDVGQQGNGSIRALFHCMHGFYAYGGTRRILTRTPGPDIHVCSQYSSKLTNLANTPMRVSNNVEK